MDTLVKKYIVLILSFSLLLVSCQNSRLLQTVNREKEIETMSEQLMKYLVDENKAGLLTLFSSDLQDNHAQEIYSQLDRAFDFINGKIVSYEYDGIHSEHESIGDGRVDFFACNAEFLNVTTDTGFKYEISLPLCYTWEKKPEREGISMIAILDAENSDNCVEVGFIYSTYD